VIPVLFDYVRPGSVDEAIGVLVEHGDEAKLLAGGHSLLPLMKLRLATPSVLVDIGRLSELSYVRAGHDAPILQRASGSLERLETGDLPLGINADAKFTCGTVTMGPHDLLVIFSDGLIEAVNDADQEFGEPRVLDVVTSSGGAGAQGTLKNLLSAVDSFVGYARQHDDITCLLLRTG